MLQTQNKDELGFQATIIESFEKWKSIVDKLGWVHCHDNVVVCDDESGFVFGEFDSESDKGWVLTDYEEYI